MKKHIIPAIAACLFCGASASAADLAVKARPAPAPAVAVYNWTGFYLGAHLGGAWGRQDDVDGGNPAITASPDPDGFLGGVQAGFNWQTGVWVWGIEGQYSWTNADGSALATTTTNIFNHSEIKSLGTLAGRVGVVVWDRGLLYAKGGWAWGKHEQFTTQNGVNITGTASESRSGWMIGGGYEYAFWDTWSAKIEYNYIDFGSERLVMPSGNQGDIDLQVHVVKAGINYRFPATWGKTPAPVVTKY